MKLVTLVTLTLSLTVDTKAQEHYTFPPHFQTPSGGLFSSDSSLYLPPESHSPMPLLKPPNHFPFQYLPPSGSKTPAGFLKPFPMLLSSTLIPPQEDDDEDGEENDTRKQPVPQFLRNQFNHTEWNLKEREKKELRPIPRTTNYQNNIDRIDMKVPYQYNENIPSTPTPKQAMPRTVMISENRMNDRVDLVKAASFPQYIQQPPPGVFISSSTEPAIPILRLSNEMDLDGSFSYEALGADQTHYVQHSRMENIGTEKEEQVVEGSYSYVGDNGQTYTVHYIADSNGFRASGDHLPVAPPIPEIIQRAVQYNLAEEAKKPPHLKSWQHEDKENEPSETEQSHRSAISPPRNLFTGRAPESFSYNFAQGPPNSQNNMATAASSQNPVIAEYRPDQMKGTMNSGTISPQITFLASQGAHVPSMNTLQQSQQSMARLFSTEKPSMPQLINYDAGIKESEDNKALWRWQYGLPVNTNQNQEKHTISRSFAEGDDIMINFSDMTPEQYTSMIKSQLGTKEQKEQGEDNRVSYDSSSDNMASTANQYFINTPQRSQADDILNYETQNLNMANKEHTRNSTLSYDSSNIRNNEYHLQNPMKSYLTEPTTNLNTENEPRTDNLIKSFDKINARDDQYYSNIPQKSYPDNSQMNNQNIENKVTNNGQAFSSEKPVNYESYTSIPTSSYESAGPENAKLPRANHGNLRPTIITQREFIPPSQTVTKSYDYEDFSYEPGEIKKANMESVTDSHEENLKVLPLSNEKTKKGDSRQNNIDTNSNVPVTQMPVLSESTRDPMRFSDFIVRENTGEFKPILSNTKPKQETTTTERNIEDIIQDNIFLKNIFSSGDNRSNVKNEQDNEFEEATISTKLPDVKADKSPKYIKHQVNPNNLNRAPQQNKLFDMSQVINYITAKQLFESNKVRPKQKPAFNNFNYKYDDSFYDNEEEELEQQNINVKPMNQQPLELRGIIKNYKVLQRNNSNLNHDQDKYKQLKRNLAPPPLKPANLPPLGRAGPSIKSYLPPVYV